MFMPQTAPTRITLFLSVSSEVLELDAIVGTSVQYTHRCGGCALVEWQAGRYFTTPWCQVQYLDQGTNLTTHVTSAISHVFSTNLLFRTVVATSTCQHV